MLEINIIVGKNIFLLFRGKCDTYISIHIEYPILQRTRTDDCEEQELNFNSSDEDQQEANDSPEIITIGDDESDGCKIDDEAKSVNCDVDGVIIKKMKDGSTIIVAGEEINLDEKL